MNDKRLIDITRSQLIEAVRQVVREEIERIHKPIELFANEPELLTKVKVRELVGKSYEWVNERISKGEFLLVGRKISKRSIVKYLTKYQVALR